MTNNLDPSRLVNVEVTLSPVGAAVRNFGVLNIVGDTNVISGVERIRGYNENDGAILARVGNDFGSSSPEYEAASIYLGHTPQPEQLYIGRWFSTAVGGFLDGGILSTAEQALANWTSITDGTFDISIDGTPQSVTALDFSLQVNLNGVASVISGAVGGATVIWDGERFIITSDLVGILSSVSFATPEGTGTDISAQLKWDSANAAVPVPGFDAETPEEAVIALYDISSDWYVASFASTVAPTEDELVDVSAFIETAEISRVHFVTNQNINELDPLITTSLAQRLQDLEYERSGAQYSSTTPAAMVSTSGEMAIVDFNGTDTVKTYMYKQQPGVVPETLTNTQANTLQAKRSNVYVSYNNNIAITQYGVMSYNLFIDERQGLDWMQNAIQVAIFNVLIIEPKVSQTDAGITQFVTAINGVFSTGVRNGLIAPGQWNGPPVGKLKTGDTLQTGYYVFAPPVSSQPQVDREARISVPISCAVKLAGAVHTVDVLVNVNR